jgi:S1-C subfamily serine protease
MKKYEDPNFEFRVRDVAEMDRAKLMVQPEEQGVLVEAVREGGWAALAQLADGDLILSIDGDVMGSVDAVRQKMEQIAARKPSTVVMHVRRDYKTFFVEMKTGW